MKKFKSVTNYNGSRHGKPRSNRSQRILIRNNNSDTPYTASPSFMGGGDSDAIWREYIYESLYQRGGGGNWKATHSSPTNSWYFPPFSTLKKAPTPFFLFFFSCQYAHTLFLFFFPSPSLSHLLFLYKK